jgi:hypothetical protein
VGRVGQVGLTFAIYPTYPTYPTYKTHSAHPTYRAYLGRLPSCSGIWSGSGGSRAANSCARSARPANRFTTPIPLTAPRTKLFVRNVRSGGHASAK